MGIKRSDTGRPGMTAEQALRSAILKQYRSLTYEELAFHLEDSRSFRAFARLNINQCPSKSVLQENIKAINAATWEAIHQLQIEYAVDQELEKGRKIRIDSTAVDSNIHHPTDSTLLEGAYPICSGWVADATDPPFLGTKWAMASQNR